MSIETIFNKNGEVTGYRFRAFVGFDENGKMVRASEKWCPDKKYKPKQLETELKAREAAFKSKIQSNKQEYLSGCVANHATSFSAFANIWLKEACTVPPYKQRTVDTYVKLLENCKLALGTLPLSKINPQQINRFLNNLREDGMNHRTGGALSEATISTYYSVLQAVFKTAVNWGIISTNPVNGVKKPKRPKHTVRALPPDDAVKVVEALAQHASKKYRLIILSFLLTGMRRGELAGLKWSAIDFDRKIIKIENTICYSNRSGTYADSPKTESSKRLIHLPESVESLLLEHKQEQSQQKKMWSADNKNSDYVFTQVDGKPMFPGTPYEWFQRFQRVYKLPKCSIHQLRHTKATLAILCGQDIKILSGQLGHSSIVTTADIYADYLVEATVEGDSKLEKMLGI